MPSQIRRRQDATTSCKIPTSQAHQKKSAKIISKLPGDLLDMGRAAPIGLNILLAFIALHALLLWQPTAATRSLLAHRGSKTHRLHWVVNFSPISILAATPPSNTTLEGSKKEQSSRPVRGDFCRINGQDPSTVSKSNRWHVVIFRFFFINFC